MYTADLLVRCKQIQIIFSGWECSFKYTCRLKFSVLGDANTFILPPPPPFSQGSAIVHPLTVKIVAKKHQPHSTISIQQNKKRSTYVIDLYPILYTVTVNTTMYREISTIYYRLAIINDPFPLVLYYKSTKFIICCVSVMQIGFTWFTWYLQIFASDSSSPCLLLLKY